MTMRVLDAHQHFWRVADQDQPWRTAQHRAIDADYTPEDLAGPAARAGVSGTVLMQSVDEPAENDRLAEFAKHDLVVGVVAWLPLSDARAAKQEWARLAIDKLSGVRCLIGRDPLDWLADSGVVAVMRELAAAGLAWDVVPLTAEQVLAVVQLAGTVPDLKIVIDHLGRPPLDGGSWQQWGDQMAVLAQCPQVAVKLSVGLDVLTNWDRWNAADLDRPIGFVADHFGAERCMLASNWPVVELRADYLRAWHDLDAAARRVFRTPAELDRVRGGTATAWYGLDVPDERT